MLIAQPAWTAFEQSDSEIKVKLGESVELTFPKEGKALLGLGAARVNGKDTKSPETVRFPLVADEWNENRGIYPILELAEVKETAEGGAAFVFKAKGGDLQELWEAYHVMAPDYDRARKELWTPELEKLEAASKAAQAKREGAIDSYPEVKSILDEISAIEALPKMGKKERKKLRGLKGKRGKLPKARKAAHQAWGEDPKNAKEMAAIKGFKEAFTAIGLKVGKPHRDVYRHSILRLPAEVCQIDERRKVVKEFSAKSEVGGTLIWTFNPDRSVVGGFEYLGWKESLTFKGEDGKTIDVARWLGTWEAGGKAVGTTVVNMRYRGLGGVEHAIMDNGKGGAKHSFSTTEIIPGAVGGAPVISPAVPSGMDVTDRGYGLRHRVGAWISQAQRGAGISVMDFQWSKDGSVILAAYPERQGNLRAVTEVFPGDATISHTDIQFTEESSSFMAVPMRYLVSTSEGMAVNELRTRWMEMDQRVRDEISEELGFVRREVRPGVGKNVDHNFGGNVAGLAGRMDSFAEQGVKDVYIHHPGWQNGRDREPGAEQGGGDCAIHDWRPLTSTQKGWTDLQSKAKEHDMAYHVWLTGMNHRVGTFYKEVGSDLKLWAINAPGDTVSSGYPPDLFNLNPNHERTMGLFLSRMKEVRQNYGYQGIWADSFQNLFMSTRDFAGGKGKPLQRMWWEMIAEWSREGVAWTGESHSMPGLSCSMEADSEPFQNWWYYIDVSRWWRTHYPVEGPEGGDFLAFRLASSRGWATPQVAYGRKIVESIPNFKPLAEAYEKARPLMRRGYNLSAERGALWMGYENDRKGIWFKFGNSSVPKGVKTTAILDGRIEGYSIHQVEGSDLIEAFGMKRGGEKDERLGRPPHKDPPFARPSN